MSDCFKLVASTGSITAPGEELTILSLLGRGTQGTVYHIKTADNREYALKLYHSSTIDRDPSISSRLKRLVQLGSPSESFCWALDYVEVFHLEKIFQGYIMKLRPPNYIAPVKFINGECQMDFKPLLKACFNLSNSFAQLHLRGLCYKDVSINNFFFHPESGDCSIIDIDNICYDSVYDYSSNVLGTPRFMAPEIVDGHAKPSIYTDYHSLAVLLFYLLLRGNPFEGLQETKIKIFDAVAQKLLYGSSSVYIYDLDDDSNRPDPNIHSSTIYMANIIPESIMSVFDSAFTKGLHDPSLRVPDSKWSLELAKAIDTLTHCTSCGQENFCSSLGIDELICWECNMRFSPLRIKMLGKDLLASPGLSLSMPDGSSSFAVVVRHPRDNSVIGLRNTSESTWIVDLPDGSSSEVVPGKSFVLGSGITVDINRAGAIVLEIV
jgi:serine/threonine protein kinase